MIKLERKRSTVVGSTKRMRPHAGEFEQILAGDYDFLLGSPTSSAEFYIECICNMMRPGPSWTTSASRG
ncbi:MAG: hypothetical protein ACLU37_13140 [Collinsella sp.]